MINDKFLGSISQFADTGIDVGDGGVLKFRGGQISGTYIIVDGIKHDLCCVCGWVTIDKAKVINAGGGGMGCP